MLEECQFEYRIIPVNINKREQFSPEFIAISPNNRMPAIVDHSFDQKPLSIFESGAILVHLAKRAGRFMPAGQTGFSETLQWLFWQTANLGPMAGQHSHFRNYAPNNQGYAAERYANEYNRCLGVLERQLADREYILGEYSIADMACWPWVLVAPRMNQPLDEFPRLASWRNTIKQRPAVRRAVDLGKELKQASAATAEDRDALFNQSARSIQSRINEHNKC